MKPIVTGLLFVLFLGGLTSCRKKQAICKGDCTTFTIHGRVTLKTTGAPLSNVIVEGRWSRADIGVSYFAGTVLTDKEGNYTLTTIIDTSAFKGYYLSISTKASDAQIPSPFSSTGFAERRFYDFDPKMLQPVNFDFYPKTTLTINAKRSGADTFDYFSIDHNFNSEVNYSDYIVAGAKLATDQHLKVSTSADIYTRISWRKTIIGGASLKMTDSIICTRNGPNIFNITY